MEPNEWSQLTKKERRELAREQRQEEQVRAGLGGKILKLVIGLLVIGLLAAAGWWFLRQPGITEEEIISRRGLHWHPELTILIKGERQEIPANIGIGAVEQPIHTHDSTGVIHMEMTGLIVKKDTRLGRFFEIWGKQFNSNCIFDFCASEEGKVKMTVNDQESSEFENYLMKDKDKIEIRYE